VKPGLAGRRISNNPAGVDQISDFDAIVDAIVGVFTNNSAEGK